MRDSLRDYSFSDLRGQTVFSRFLIEGPFVRHEKKTEKSGLATRDCC